MWSNSHLNVKTETLRRFVLLADELNFTRSAHRLRIAQQVLSAQIKDLESQIGTRLFDRTTQSVALTPAGEELVEVVRQMLTTLDEGVEGARRRGSVQVERLRIGFVAQGAGVAQNRLIRDLRLRHPEVQIDIRSFSFADPYAGLLEGLTDVAFLRNPLPHPDIELAVISSEPRVVLAPHDHPLAGQEAVRPSDLIPYPAIVVRGYRDNPELGAWMTVHTLADLIGERPEGAVVETPEEWLQAAGDGRGFTTTPASVPHFYPRAGMVGVPVIDVEPLAFAIGWRTNLAGGELVASVVQTARSIAADLKRDGLQNP